MTMFSQFLLAQGIDVEMSQPLDEVLGYLEKTVSEAHCESYRYHLAPKRGDLGRSWELIVRPVRTEKDGKPVRQVLDVPIGYVKVGTTEEGKTLLSVPPRDQWATPQAATVDTDGRLFASLLFQMLNAFNSRGLISLPGELPVR